MGEVFKNVLVLSLTGTAVSVVLMMIKPFTRKVFSPVWQYYMWLAVLIVFILPFKFNLPLRPADVNPGNDIINRVAEPLQKSSENVRVFTDTVFNTAVTENTGTDIMNVLAYIWICGAAMILIYRLVSYIACKKAIYNKSYADGMIENLPVRKTSMIYSPLIIGLFKPVLYIPDMDIKTEEMNYIIKHELTHYKRFDILYKWFAMAVSCIHWFNPVMYILLKEIDEECEISCDYTVAVKMSQEERTEYMKVILELAAISINRKSMLSTQMAGSKKILKRRFDMIKNAEKTKIYITVTGIAAAVIVISVFAFAGGVIRGKNSDIPAVSETSTEQTDITDEITAADENHIANYDLIHNPLFDAENIKYSRDYIGDELNRRDKLSYEYQWNNMRPSKSMSERTADEGMYFDISNNMVVYPERELTDDEILALVEFQFDINSLYEQNRAKPVSGMISEQEAVETAKNEILYFYGAVSSDYNISCGYNEAGEDGYGSDKNVFSVMFEPVDMPYLEEQNTDYHVYFVDIEAETGNVITVDSYYSGMGDETEEVKSLSDTERADFEKKSREVMRNIPNLGNVKEQYINPSGERSVCTVFELDGKELKVELTYPNMEKVGWSVEG